MKPTLLSVVIPVYNEEKSIPDLFRRLQSALGRTEYGWEVIFVDDGSTDGTGRILDGLYECCREAGVIHFRRNFGKAAALAAGFKAAQGEIVVTMDGDLQDQPEEIPAMIVKLGEGYDLVSGWKYPRRDPWRRRLASRIYNRITCLVSGLHLHDMNCGFKVYRREVTGQLNLYGELHRYIPVIAHHAGFRVGEMKVSHQPRAFGTSKYGIWRFFSGFFDLFTVLMLTRYGGKPLHIFGLTGLAASLAGGGITAYLIVLRIFGEYLTGQPQYLSNRPVFYFALSLLIVGVQIIFFGLLAEMIAHSRNPETFYNVRSVKLHSPAGQAGAQP